ncbi:RNA dependent RNA polymerase-domain-containing protein [Mycena olivaceomarginata]|nr:RNA dependent RNA polymerase-domain-containing protein [Mycena olivaceomarginata]
MPDQTFLVKHRVPFIGLQIDFSDGGKFGLKEYYGHESRATRLVGDSRRFMTVSFAKGSRDPQIKPWLQQITEPGEGIVVDDNKYVFFGFTESHLKAGNLLFFREGADFTVETFIQSLGNLPAVYVQSGYGTYAARKGLSFSSTVATEEIDPSGMIVLPDLVAEDGSITSDGCGLIRASDLARICGLLDVSPETTVLQVRLGGFKGVLTRCPDGLFDQIPGCSNKKIAWRRSMKKYEGGPQVLEVQDVSRLPKSGRLNKQFIVLLLTRGIPPSVFDELLQMQLDEIDKITTDREKALACVGGEIDAEGDSFFQDLKEMLLAGHNITEPYLATLLCRFQNTTRKKLRDKLQIPVKDSSYMFGVVDHCGVLKEGEVYINIRIRVLEAVNKPELKHFTNCIVFSASGTHSETDRMGGGDLDGDQYYVIFNPQLIPESAPPPALRPKKIARRTITIAGHTHTIPSPVKRNMDKRTDAINTFIEHRCNFVVGEMSNTWMDLVGATPELANNAECKALVPLIEDALDAVKSGGGLRRIKDDFRRVKNRIEARVVDNRWVNPLEALADQVPAPIPENMNFTPDPDLVLKAEVDGEEWDGLVRQAKVEMKKYNDGLRSTIDADKEIKGSGFDAEKRAEIFKAETITQHFAGFDNILLDTRKYLLKASVWYVVGYEKKKQSFAWLGARWLNFIKARRTGVVPVSVGARSTPLVPQHKMPAFKLTTTIEITDSALSSPSHASTLPPTRAASPELNSPIGARSNTPDRPQPAERVVEPEPELDPRAGLVSAQSGLPHGQPLVPRCGMNQAQNPRAPSPTSSTSTNTAQRKAVVSPSPSDASRSSHKHQHCAYLIRSRLPNVFVCSCGPLSSSAELG